MMLGRASFWGKDIQALGRRAAAGAYAAGKGAVVPDRVEDKYVVRILRDYKPGRPLTVAWDAGNGAAGPIMRALTRQLPGRHVLLNDEIDGRFPAHHPDPTVPENLEQLRQAVREHGADVGIAFDGDADRIGVVDGRGRILWGDQILALLARDVLAERPGPPTIAASKPTRGRFDEVARLARKPLTWPTPHPPLKTNIPEPAP